MKTRLIRAVAMVAAVACNTDEGSAPVWTSLTLSPPPNAVGVSRGDTLRMWFDMPVDSASCAARFTLHTGDTLGPAVAGHMRFADGYRQMMLVPDAPMAPSSLHFAHMRDSMMTREGWSGGMGGGMMGTGMMGGRRMMFGAMPAGAVRMGDGMGWSFTTGP